MNFSQSLTSLWSNHFSTVLSMGKKGYIIDPVSGMSRDRAQSACSVQVAWMLSVSEGVVVMEEAAAQGQTQHEPQAYPRSSEWVTLGVSSKTSKDHSSTG